MSPSWGEASGGPRYRCPGPVSCYSARGGGGSSHWNLRNARTLVSRQGFWLHKAPTRFQTAHVPGTSLYLHKKKNNPIRSGCCYKENIIQAKFFIVFAFFFSFGHERIFKGPELQCVLARQVAPPMCLRPQYRGVSGASGPAGSLPPL